MTPPSTLPEVKRPRRRRALPPRSREEAYKRWLAVLFSVVTLLVAVATFLQSGAAARSAVLTRTAQQRAIASTGNQGTQVDGRRPDAPIGMFERVRFPEAEPCVIRTRESTLVAKTHAPEHHAEVLGASAVECHLNAVDTSRRILDRERHAENVVVRAEGQQGVSHRHI